MRKKSPCPTTAQLIHALIVLSEYYTSLDGQDNINWHTRKRFDEKEVFRILCLALKSLEGCDLFWDKLWVGGPDEAKYIIDLSKVNRELNQVSMNQLKYIFAESFDRDEEKASDFLMHQIGEIREAYNPLFGSMMNSASYYKVRNNARKATKELRDKICTTHSELQNKYDIPALDIFLKGIKWILRGAIFGILANPKAFSSMVHLGSSIYKTEDLIIFNSLSLCSMLPPPEHRSIHNIVIPEPR